MDEITLDRAQEDFLREVEANGVADCPCCLRQLRERDTKGLNRWMGGALKLFVSLYRVGQSFHGGTTIKGTVWANGHDFSRLRWWGFITEIEAPEDASGEGRGSRKMTGWYALSQKGVDFANGKISVPKNAVRRYNEDEYSIEGPAIFIGDVLDATLVTNSNNIVTDGTTV